jgi:threonine synthase
VSRNDKMLSSVSRAIGHTPLAELNRVTKDLEGKQPHSKKRTCESSAILLRQPVVPCWRDNLYATPVLGFKAPGIPLPELTFLRLEYIDGYNAVTDDDVIAMARRLAKEERIFAGFYSGANVAAAAHLLQGP